METPLARARAKAGLYQHELARAIGISVDSYRRLERGEMENAPLWWYTNCAIALNVQLEDILGLLSQTWRPSGAAEKPPGLYFLADRSDRAEAWDVDLPDE